MPWLRWYRAGLALHPPAPRDVLPRQPRRPLPDVTRTSPAKQPARIAVNWPGVRATASVAGDLLRFRRRFAAVVTLDKWGEGLDAGCVVEMLHGGNPAVPPLDHAQHSTARRLAVVQVVKRNAVQVTR